MEKVDYFDSGFTWRKMLPETNNELTALWGRKVVHNLINGYGLIGTILLESERTEYLNLELTKKFVYPPHPFFFIVSGARLDTLREGHRDDKQIHWAIDNDILIIRNGKNFIGTSQTVVYKIHGC